MVTLKEKLQDVSSSTSTDSTNYNVTYDNKSWKGYVDNTWDTDYGIDIDFSDWNDNIDYDNRKNENDKETEQEVEIYREVEADEVIIISMDKLKEEIGDIDFDDIEERLKYWVMICVNCGFKDAFPRFWKSPEAMINMLNSGKLGLSSTSSHNIACPNCGSTAVGIPKENEEDLIEEILKGE